MAVSAADMRQITNQLDRRYLRAQNVARMAESTQTLVGQVGTTAIRIKDVTLPLIVLGGNFPVTVTWQVAMPVTTYNVYISYESILGSATIGTVVTSKTGVTFTVTASVLLAAGARLLVIAWYDPT